MHLELAASYVGLSVGSIANERKAGRFPEPVSLTRGRIVWLREDLDAWLDRKAGKAAPEDAVAGDGSEWVA
jgi:predicted DNA-binding transcriptional regulator AlpA